MNKISTKNCVFSIILAIFGVLAIRFNGVPMIYIGLIFAFLSIGIIGLFSNKTIAAILGLFVIGLGFFIRNKFPVVSTLKGDKLTAFLAQEAAYKDFYTQHMIFLVLAGAIIGLLFGSIGERLQEDKTDKFTPSKLTYMALFVAIGVILNTVRIGSISFGGFPIILSGFLLGPIPGFIVGTVTDLVAFLVRPSSTGSFSVLFTLTSGLTGLIPVVITGLLGERYPKYTFIKVLIGIIVGQFLTSVLMAPFFSQLLFGRVFAVDAMKALVKQAVSVPVYALLVVTLNDRISKVVKFDKI